MPTVCVDANIVVALTHHRDSSGPAIELWSSWSTSQTSVIAPPLLIPEVTSALRKLVHFRRMSVEDGETAFRLFADLPIAIQEHRALSATAWSLARQFDRPNAYDAVYVAAAQLEDCELWTGDRRLVNAFRLPNIRWVGELATAG